MADYQWNFSATGASSAVQLSKILSKLDKITALLTRRTIQSAKAHKTASTAIKQSEKSQQGLFKSMTRLAGVWNTWNKAIDFGAKRLRQLVGIFGTFKDVAGTFERAEAEFRAFAIGAGASADEIEKMVQQSKELGRTTEFTATQTLQAAVTMVKAGTSVTDALRDQEAALNGAAAAGIEVSHAYSIGNRVLKIFSNDVENVNDALKIQIATAQSAQTNITQLDKAMQKGGSVAKKVGLSFLDFNAALALMAPSGLVASEAGRLLTNGMLRLTNGTIPAAKALKELGVTARTSEGGFRQAADVLEDLKNALAKEDLDTQIKLMKDLFGARSLKAFIPLIQAGATGFEEMKAKILGAEESMERLREFKENTIVGAFKKLVSASEGLWISFKNITTLPLQTFLTSLAGILNEIARRIEALEGRDIGSFFEGLLEAVGPELQKLEELFIRAAKVLGEILGSAIEFIFTEDVINRVKEQALQFGHAMGEAIGEGLKKQIKDSVLPILEGVLDAAGNLSSGFSILSGVLKVSKKGAEPTVVPPSKEFTEGLKGVENISEGPKDLRQLTEEAITAREENLPVVQEEVSLEEQKNAELEEALQLQEQMAETEEEIVGLEEKQLSNQIAIVQGQREQASLTDQIALSQSKLTMGLNEYAANFKKAMLEPWDQFKSKLLEVRNKFGEMIAGLKATKIDLLEKVGLVTEEGAAKQRFELGQEQFYATQRRMGLAQSPAEKAELQEQLAEQAAALSEQAPEGQAEQFKSQIQPFLDAAIRSRQQQQAIEEEKIAIDKQLAEDNVNTLKQSLPQAQTAQEQVKILEQLDSSLQQLGRVDESAQLQAQLQEAQRQAAGESVELLKLMLEQLMLANEQRVKKADEQKEELRLLREEQAVGMMDPYLQNA